MTLAFFGVAGLFLIAYGWFTRQYAAMFHGLLIFQGVCLVSGLSRAASEG